MAKKNKKKKLNLLQKMQFYWALHSKISALPQGREKRKALAKLNRMHQSIMSHVPEEEYMNGWVFRLSEELEGMGLEKEDYVPDGRPWWALSISALEFSMRKFLGTTKDAADHATKEFFKKFQVEPTKFIIAKFGRYFILGLGPRPKHDEDLLRQLLEESPPPTEEGVE